MTDEDIDHDKVLVESPTALNNGVHDDSTTESDTEHEFNSTSEDESDEDEDEEPSLKYERVGGALPDLLKKDSSSALFICNNILIMGTHAGLVHMLDMHGKRLQSFKPHAASIVDICTDETGDFIATASMDGQVVIKSLTTPDTYSFDLKRPMRTIALEPNFAKRSTRSFVCGGLAGNIVLREKGWLGHKEVLLHSGEGPIWQTRWRGRLIAWANDLGVKIYDTSSQSRITFIDRPPESPRPDLFKCNLQWQDDTTLLIAWADHIKVARIRERPRTHNPQAPSHTSGLFVEITAVFQLDCMIAGAVPNFNRSPHPPEQRRHAASIVTQTTASSKHTNHNHFDAGSLLILAYTPPDTSFLNEEAQTRAQQARKLAERPELRIISRGGDELAADALSVTNYQTWGCNDYFLVQTGQYGGDGQACVVLSPKDVILVRRRDDMDHIQWLVERKRYEEALASLDELDDIPADSTIDPTTVGQDYITHLVAEGDFVKASQLCPKVCASDSKRWEDWIFVFAERRQMKAIIPYVPTDSPRLDRVVYEMILAHLLTHDRKALLQTIKDWPKEIYDLPAVLVAIHAELDRIPASSSKPPSTPDSALLMECLAELYIINRQPGKALGYYLRLRRPNVFTLIRENNLFTDVQDQILLLVEFDHELMEKRRQAGEELEEGKSNAISLLVENMYSIPVIRVVQQLRERPKYLFHYLDALAAKDLHLVSEFADDQVSLYAEYAPNRLIDFFRASNAYKLEKAYSVCQKRDLVPEMVFLLGRMGNNRKALTLIIERLGDVHRAIDFAKEQADDDLWEDLLKYSETRPDFIRGLLENVGPEINPVRLIRRIKNGLQIPGLKEALIKILQDFHLQSSLLEGCQAILDSDSAHLSRRLQRDQTSGFLLTGHSACPICTRPLQDTSQGLAVLFLCRHIVHASCASGGDNIPTRLDPALRGIGLSGAGASSRGLNGKIAFEAQVRVKLDHGCPVCHKNSEGLRT